MPTPNTGEIALIIAISTPFLQVFATWLGKRKNEERAALFQQVALDQAGLKNLNDSLNKQVERLQQDCERMSNYIQDLQEWNRDMDVALRTANLPVPNPPWSKRFSGPYRGA